jgi:diguanylate cyclase (GGDEF)-like protein/PAS domain S-box-containing protein
MRPLELKDRDQKELIDQLMLENFALKEALQLKSEQLHAVFDRSEVKTWQLDIPSERLKVFNAPWGELLGYQPEEVEASVAGWKGNLHPEDRDFVVAALEKHLRGESDAFEVVHRMIRKGGDISWISDRGRVVEFDENGKPLRMIGAHCDITQEKLYEQKLSKMVNLDPLTGLMNRKAFIDNYTQCDVNVERSSSLLFLDLDDFKHVNDQYGHKFGDMVLCYIAELLQSLLPSNASICRFGGDEFLISHPKTERHALQQLCEELLAPFQTPIIIEKERLDIGLSIGISIFNSTEESFEEVCHRADKAMYTVKNTGKNNVAFW